MLVRVTCMSPQVPKCLKVPASCACVRVSVSVSVCVYCVGVSVCSLELVCLYSVCMYMSVLLRLFMCV